MSTSIHLLDLNPDKGIETLSGFKSCCKDIPVGRHITTQFRILRRDLRVLSKFQKGTVSNASLTLRETPRHTSRPFLHLSNHRLNQTPRINVTA